MAAGPPTARHGCLRSLAVAAVAALLCSIGLGRVDRSCSRTEPHGSICPRCRGPVTGKLHHPVRDRGGSEARNPAHRDRYHDGADRRRQLDRPGRTRGRRAAAQPRWQQHAARRGPVLQPAGVIWHPRCPARTRSSTSASTAPVTTATGRTGSVRAGAMSAAFDANAGEVVTPHQALGTGHWALGPGGQRRRPGFAWYRRHQVSPMRTAVSSSCIAMSRSQMCGLCCHSGSGVLPGGGGVT